ncbi:hypothetical protein CLCR_04359 [Cladophialophora carrionii]|uniref:Uncharacterized protein n=1 Tax=Cladophialophora carrionii TaxID=86049 RepID=A0A1C1CIL5_9EURO|nr:hypothetical protein CLCR_04359 [Cladophialophora carrionii]
MTEISARQTLTSVDRVMSLASTTTGCPSEQLGECLSLQLVVSAVQQQRKSDSPTARIIAMSFYGSSCFHPLQDVLSVERVAMAILRLSSPPLSGTRKSDYPHSQRSQWPNGCRKTAGWAATSACLLGEGVRQHQTLWQLVESRTETLKRVCLQVSLYRVRNARKAIILSSEDQVSPRGGGWHHACTPLVALRAQPKWTQDGKYLTRARSSCSVRVY